MASPEATTPAPRLLVPILVVGLLVGVFVVVAWPSAPSGGPGTHRDAPPVASVSSRVEAQAAAVLREWDRRRAAAGPAGPSGCREARRANGTACCAGSVAPGWSRRSGPFRGPRQGGREDRRDVGIAELEARRREHVWPSIHRSEQLGGEATSAEPDRR